GADRLKPALNIEKARLPHDSLVPSAHGHCNQRVRFAATWREEFFEVPKSFRLARDLRLLHDLASPIHNANAREFQRDVDSCIVFHGCPPSQMPGADSTS